jgi:5-formyltetrahydrofolate cyclo-ligase
MNKKELRNIYKEKRLAISQKEKLKLDDMIFIRFQQLYFEKANVLFTYSPKAGANEPDTHSISRYLQYIIPLLQIAYPVADTTTCTMEAMLINEETIFNTNKYGISEPAEGLLLEPDKIDIVFVPLIIYDEAGYRVGYGKGYYDKYLSQCREDVVKIGFSYFDPVENIDDRDVFDVPLNFCITPEKVYEF